MPDLVGLFTHVSHHLPWSGLAGQASVERVGLFSPHTRLEKVDETFIFKHGNPHFLFAHMNVLLKFL
jgi:hypothetical protein